MAWTSNIPISGAQGSAQPICDNFTYLKDVTDGLLNNSILSGSTANLVITNNLTNSGSTNLIGAITTVGDICINSTNSNDPQILGFGNTHSLQHSQANGEFRISRNLNILDTSLRIGTGVGGTPYIWFTGNSEIMGPDTGLRSYAGLLQWTNDNGSTWQNIAVSSSAGPGYLGLKDVITYNPYATGSTAYIKKLYIEGANYPAHVKLLTDDYPEIEFVNAVGSGSSIHYTDDYKFIITGDTYFQTATIRNPIYAKDLYLSPQDGLYTDPTKIYFGNTYYGHYIQDDGGLNSTLRFTGWPLIVFNNSTLFTSGSINTGTSFGVNSDYISGDEDAIINFNNSTQTLKFDYGDSAFVASAPNFQIGNGGASDQKLYFRDSSASKGWIGIENSSHKIRYADS